MVTLGAHGSAQIMRIRRTWGPKSALESARNPGSGQFFELRGFPTLLGGCGAQER